jgi:hypothetical protein
LTKPYSGGPVRHRRIPSLQATIARLPQTAFNDLVSPTALKLCRCHFHPSTRFSLQNLADYHVEAGK